MAAFRYPLEPVLAQRQWQLETLRLEADQARRLLGMREDAVAALRARAQAVLQGFESLRGAGQTLDLERDARLRRYQAQLQQQLEHALAALAEAEHLHEQLRGQLRQALQAVQGLQRHREDQRAGHAAAQAVAAGKEADDQWLLGRGAAGEHR